MTIEATTQWICDECGEIIQCAKDGCVQWATYRDKDGRLRGRGLRIVHHYTASPLKDEHEHGCYLDHHPEFTKDGGTLSDLSVESFLGPDGLTRLLSFLARDEIPAGEVVEIIKRIHIPGYEMARPYIERAVAEGMIEPNLPEGFYWQREIKCIIENRDRLDQ